MHLRGYFYNLTKIAGGQKRKMDNNGPILNQHITFNPKFKPGDFVRGNVDGYEFTGIVEHITLRAEVSPSGNHGYAVYCGVRREHGLGGYDSEVCEYREIFLSPDESMSTS